jgi:hypothetical protein
LPVSLSYHAAGIRVDQRPGWTGLGWTLFAGGAITRSVKDIPDEYNNPNYYFGGNFGYYYTYNVLNVNNWNDRTYLRSIAQSDQGTLADTDPDEFSFNFTGYSGKFYLNHKREWVVQCNKPVKVEFNETFLQIPFDKERTRAEIYGYSHCFSGFTLITENGTKYIFGNILMLLIFL